MEYKINGWGQVARVDITIEQKDKFDMLLRRLPHIRISAVAHLCSGALTVQEILDIFENEES